MKREEISSHANNELRGLEIASANSQHERPVDTVVNSSEHAKLVK